MSTSITEALRFETWSKIIQLFSICYMRTFLARLIGVFLQFFFSQEPKRDLHSRHFTCRFAFWRDWSDTTTVCPPLEDGNFFQETCNSIGAWTAIITFNASASPPRPNLPPPLSLSLSKNHVTLTVMSLSKHSFFRQPKRVCLATCVHNADNHHHHVLGYGNCFL